jgi:hypothetical protein
MTQELEISQPCRPTLLHNKRTVLPEFQNYGNLQVLSNHELRPLIRVKQASSVTQM